MKIPYSWRPGAGFLFLAAVVIVSAAFFAWGVRTPPLEKEWRVEMQHK